MRNATWQQKHEVHHVVPRLGSALVMAVCSLWTAVHEASPVVGSMEVEIQQLSDCKRRDGVQPQLLLQGRIPV